ncbi:MAG: tetratricopeptide repeat protein [Myxococcota bacterium]|nr:tetratricopeptide repeat protein [Myxococcota bacterium]
MEQTLKQVVLDASEAYSAGRSEQASRLCEEGLGRAPSSAPLLHLKGLLCYQAENYAGATHWIERAIAHEGSVADYHNSLGVVLKAQDKTEQAVVAYREAIGLRPNFAEAFNNLGDALTVQGGLREAEGHYRRAIAFHRGYTDAIYNLGNTLKEQGRLKEAVAEFDRCLALDGEHPGAHWNRSLTLLLMGEYELGWPGYEWRFVQPGFPGRREGLSAPLWEGQSLLGKRLLVCHEQGLGDVFHYLRFRPRLLEQAAEVILEVPERLRSQVQTLDARVRVEAPEMGREGIDYQVPLMSLPLWLGVRGEDIRMEQPYLSVLPDARARVEALLGGTLESGKPRVGIHWQGDPGFRGDQHRSIPLHYWRPLWEVEGVQWISLQKGKGREQLEGLSQVLDAGALLDEGSDAFVETAALLERLDWVITTDTALAHLAGALGKETWLLLGVHPDWRWGLKGERCPWYPSLRLFRQTERLDWGTLMERVVCVLRERVSDELS